jgi:hypothetical protein
MRRWLLACAVPHLPLDTRGPLVLKIGGRVWQVSNHERLRLATRLPGQPLWNQLAAHRHPREQFRLVGNGGRYASVERHHDVVNQIVGVFEPG